MKRWQAWVFYVFVLLTGMAIRVPLFGDTGSNHLLTALYYGLACVVSWIFYFTLIGFVYTLQRTPSWVRRHRALKQEMQALEEDLRNEVEKITSSARDRH